MLLLSSFSEKTIVKAMIGNRQLRLGILNLWFSVHLYSSPEWSLKTIIIFRTIFSHLHFESIKIEKSKTLMRWAKLSAARGPKTINGFTWLLTIGPTIVYWKKNNLHSVFGQTATKTKRNPWHRIYLSSWEIQHLKMALIHNGNLYSNQLYAYKVFHCFFFKYKYPW